MTLVIKPLGAQVDISAANSTVSNSGLVLVMNTGAPAAIRITNGNNSNTEWANLTLGNSYPVIIRKSANDYIRGAAGFTALPVAY